MILEKMRSCLWKLEPGFWTCSWICLLGPSGPNVVFRPQAQGPLFFFEISWFYWIHLIIHEKMRSCFWKLKLGFLSNGLISPLEKALSPNCPKLVFRPQTSNVRALRSGIFVMSSSIKFCIRSCLQILGHFWQSYKCLFPENCKKPFKNLLLVPFKICNFPLSLV